jgi:translation initiation factor 2 gamma subunit (eIF-2gamma)
MHFVLAGMALGLAVPGGLLFASTKLDPRVRSATDLSTSLGVPLLVCVPRHLDARQLRRERWRSVFTVLIVIGTLSAYAVVGWLRFSRTL